MQAAEPPAVVCAELLGALEVVGQVADGLEIEAHHPQRKAAGDPALDHAENSVVPVLAVLEVALEELLVGVFDRGVDRLPVLRRRQAAVGEVLVELDAPDEDLERLPEAVDLLATELEHALGLAHGLGILQATTSRLDFEGSAADGAPVGGVGGVHDVLLLLFSLELRQ